MKPLSLLLIFTLLFSSSLAAQQQGSITGTVVDGNGSPLVDVSITATTEAGGESSANSRSDERGYFKISNLSIGSYILRYEYSFFNSEKPEPIQVTANQETPIGSIVLHFNISGNRDSGKGTFPFDDKQKEDAKNAQLATNKNDSKFHQLCAIQYLELTAQADFRSALRTTPGVSVDDGKNIFQRSLSDKSKLSLNGLDVPGMDADLNMEWISVFPAALMKEPKVTEFFYPNGSSSFSGSTIALSFQDFPKASVFRIGLTSGYNQAVHYKNTFLTYPGGKTDWLGFDDGTRDLPPPPEGGVPTRYESEENDNLLWGFTRSFNKNVKVDTSQRPLDFGANIEFGKTTKLLGNDLGITGMVAYKQVRTGYWAGWTGRFKLVSEVDSTQVLYVDRWLNDNRCSEKVILGGQLNLSYKIGKRNKITLRYSRVQQGKKDTRFQEGILPGTDVDFIYQERTMAYQQKQSNTLALRTSHELNESKTFLLNLSASYQTAASSQPDLRFFGNVFTIDSTSGERVYEILTNVGSSPFRITRLTEDVSWDMKADFSYQFPNKAQTAAAKLSGGLGMNTRERVFREWRYQFEQDQPNFNGDFVQYFSDENLFSPVNPMGVFAVDASQSRNQYDAEQMIGATYLMAEGGIGKALKYKAGIRVEIAGIFFTSLYEELMLNNTLLLDEITPLPVAELAYQIVPNKLTAVAYYGRTISRPSFKELAPVVFFEEVNNAFVTGNTELESTLIDNFNLGFSYKPNENGNISVNAFYRNFNNQIEVVFTPTAKNLDLTYRNATGARLYGMDVELVKRLNFSPTFQPFSVGGQFTWVNSTVQMDSLEFASIIAQNPYAGWYRQMYGQAPWTVAAFVAYENQVGTNASAGFSMQGDRLMIVSRNGAPNIFERSFPSLDVNCSQRLGAGFSISLGARNLLNSTYKLTQTFKGTEYLFRSFVPGRYYQLGVTWDIPNQ